MLNKGQSLGGNLSTAAGCTNKLMASMNSSSTKTGVNLVSNVTNVKFLTQYGSSVKNGPKGLYSESYKCD